MTGAIWALLLVAVLLGVFAWLTSLAYADSWRLRKAEIERLDPALATIVRSHGMHAILLFLTLLMGALALLLAAIRGIFA